MALELLVREDSNQYIHHDQLFKQLLHTFYSEFLEAFFPEVYRNIDFSSLKPLSFYSAAFTYTSKQRYDLLHGTVLGSIVLDHNGVGPPVM